MFERKQIKSVHRWKMYVVKMGKYLSMSWVLSWVMLMTANECNWIIRVRVCFRCIIVVWNEQRQICENWQIWTNVRDKGTWFKVFLFFVSIGKHLLHNIDFVPAKWKTSIDQRVSGQKIWDFISKFEHVAEINENLTLNWSICTFIMIVLHQIAFGFGWAYVDGGNKISNFFLLFSEFSSSFVILLNSNWKNK